MHLTRNILMGPFEFQAETTVWWRKKLYITGCIKIAPETKGFSLFTGRYLAGHQNLLVFF